MACQLFADCFEEIFEFLKNDKVTLHSCLLVNHLLCEISVRILWRNIWDFKPKSDALLKILSTLVACLPNESKSLLYEKGIFISTPTSKPPLFDYISFCKSLSIRDICKMIKSFLNNQQSGKSRNLKKSEKLITN